MKLINSKICRGRYKIQFRIKRWFFGKRKAKKAKVTS